MKKKCLIESCNNEPYRKGICNIHRIKIRRYGDPLAGTSHTLHGMHKTRIYVSWQSMKDRCHNVNSYQYHNYGARGITVCDEWRESFANFLKDMGLPPTNKHTLDRIDVNDNYSKTNCRWATWIEQANNTRRNRLFTINGETKTLTQWIREYNLNANTVRARIRLGWSIEEALNTMPRSSHQPQ